MAHMADYLPNIDEGKLKRVLEIKSAYSAGSLDLNEARAQLRHAVLGLKAHELAYIEQQFQEEDPDECRKEDIQSMLELYQGILDTTRPDLPEDHPIARYYQECAAMEKLLLAIEDLVQYPLIKNQWAEIYDQMLTWKTHLSRKQNQLYSVLEKKGFTRPTTTMWTLDDFIRDEISEAAALLNADKDEEFLAMQPTLVADIRDLNEKEQTVLYPTSLDMISVEEFEDMKSGDAEIGYALISVDKNEQVDDPKAKPEVDEAGLAQDLAALLASHGFVKGGEIPRDQKLHVAEGSLTLEQINLIYKHLPVDLSYVDENELVCFYSDTKPRVFPRSKNVIGRDVKNCHPRKSVHIVEEIISKFRSGEQDEAEFWINKPDLFIYIKYVAVRDEEGAFRGVLEMMQDCTHIRSLEGSRTLLTWDNEQDGEEGKTEIAPEPEQVEAKPSVKSVSEIGPDTKLSALIAQKPELKKELPNWNDAFKVIHTPLARVMLPKATVAMMAERSGMDLDVLISKLRDYMGLN